MSEAAQALHLGDVLVPEAKAIGAKGDIGIGLEPLDQGLAAAGIAGHGVARVRPIGREQGGLDQRRDQRDEPGGVAPRIADAQRTRHGVAADQFGKAISPACRDAVCGGGVDHAGGVVGDHRHRRHSRIVRQAQDHEIGGVECFCPRRIVLAAGFGQGDQGKFAATREPIGDFQPGRADCAVDEHALRHSRYSAAAAGRAGWIATIGT